MPLASCCWPRCCCPSAQPSCKPLLAGRYSAAPDASPATPTTPPPRCATPKLPCTPCCCCQVGGRPRPSAGRRGGDRAGLTSPPGELTLCNPVLPGVAAPRAPTARRPPSAPSAAPSSWCVFGCPPANASVSAAAQPHAEKLPSHEQTCLPSRMQRMAHLTADGGAAGKPAPRYRPVLCWLGPSLPSSGNIRTLSSFVQSVRSQQSAELRLHGSRRAGYVASRLVSPPFRRSFAPASADQRTAASPDRARSSARCAPPLAGWPASLQAASAPAPTLRRDGEAVGSGRLPDACGEAERPKAMHCRAAAPAAAATPHCRRRCLACQCRGTFRESRRPEGAAFAQGVRDALFTASTSCQMFIACSRRT